MLLRDCVPNKSGSTAAADCTDAGNVIPGFLYRQRAMWGIRRHRSGCSGPIRSSTAEVQHAEQRNRRLALAPAGVAGAAA